MRSHGDMQRRRVRFERHASQVVFDPATNDFVVTWAKCNLPVDQRIAARRDPLVWIPSVSAIATLYDRGRVPQGQTVYAAMAVGRAWAAGDRDMLDTEGAKKAAELVHDLSTMCVNAASPSVARDVGQAMRHLLDEMAYVRFLNTPTESLEDAVVMPPLDKSIAECFGLVGFSGWPAPSMRRRFMFCLNKRERTEVAYTLVSLLFDVGSCPLLSLTDRRLLRMQAIKSSGIEANYSPESVHAFFSYALSKMREAKADGRPNVGSKMTQQQLADSLPDGTEKRTYQH